MKKNNKLERKIKTGSVVSKKTDKTIMVEIERVFRHKMYGKIIRTKKKYMVHDEKNVCKPGDIVQIIESKPISKMKRWAVVEIIKKG